MHFRKWLEQNQFSNVWNKLMRQYPRVHGSNDLVDGRRVLNQVDNMSSISASLMNYRILPGIRRIKTSEFQDWTTPYIHSYSVERTNRVRNLAAQIQKSNRIMPLIVVVDKDGPYVLEGSHRYDALHLLNAKEFPAIIVVDIDEIHEF